jgi:homoserine kinase
MDKVTVRVPATTANLGPAYDIIGLAMDLWLTTTVERADVTSVEMTGEGAGIIKDEKENLIVKCFDLAVAECGAETFPIKVTVHNEIPFGCGCGSSSAATVAGVVAAFLMLGKKLSAKNEELLQIATRIEGHPDNAAPAIYGGMQLGLHGEGRWHTHRISVPNTLWIVLFTPTKKMKLHTNETRKLIPTEVPMADAIHNMTRATLLVHSFATGDFAAMKSCADDRFHQQQRAPLFPHMNPAVEAAFANGAVYSSLSGAGPTIVAFVPGRSGDTALMDDSERTCDVVGKAMVAAAEAAGVPGRYIVTSPSAVGAHKA